MRYRYITTLLLYLALQSSSQSAASNPRLCYYDSSKLAPAEILPCFEGGPISPCCMKGSNCLANNACWDPDSGVTYQYGCTDKTYQDDKCPKKCGYDTRLSPWVGLVYCDGNDTNSISSKIPNDTWLCHHPQNCGGPKVCPSASVWPSTPTMLNSVTCAQLLNPSATAFFDGNPIQSILVLPKDSVGLVSYFSAHPLTATPSSLTPSTSAIISISTIASATPTTQIASTFSTLAAASTTAPSGIWNDSGETTSPSPGTQSAATSHIGLGVGIGLPAGLLVVVIIGFYSWRKRKENKETKANSIATPPTPKTEAYHIGGDGNGFAYKAELDSTPVASPTIDSGDAENGKGLYEMETPQTSPAPAHQEFQHIQPTVEIYEMEGSVPLPRAPQELPSPGESQQKL